MFLLSGYREYLNITHDEDNGLLCFSSSSDQVIFNVNITDKISETSLLADVYVGAYCLPFSSRSYPDVRGPLQVDVEARSRIGFMKATKLYNIYREGIYVANDSIS